MKSELFNDCIELFYRTSKKYTYNERFEKLRDRMYECVEILYNNKIYSKIVFTSPNEYEESMKKGNKEIA